MENEDQLGYECLSLLVLRKMGQGGRLKIIMLNVPASTNLSLVAAGQEERIGPNGCTIGSVTMKGVEKRSLPSLFRRGDIVRAACLRWICRFGCDERMAGGVLSG